MVHGVGIVLVGTATADLEPAPPGEQPPHVFQAYRPTTSKQTGRWNRIRRVGHRVSPYYQETVQFGQTRAVIPPLIPETWRTGLKEIDDASVRCRNTIVPTAR